MYIELALTQPDLPRMAVRAYDPELDDVRSILMDVCEALEGNAVFSVSGFGQDVWPVDVRTDLAVFMEQLPEILAAIGSGRATVLDFYEQGVERTIGFTPAGGDYLLSCVSATSWVPDGTPHCMERVRLQQMMSAIQGRFLAFVGAAAPELLNHDWLRTWLQHTEHGQS
jgi:hypothetical protein